MSTMGAQPLPDSLLYFLVATDGLQAPENVNKTRCMLWDISKAALDESTRRKPRDLLNRRIGQARRRDAEQFLDIALWAYSDEVGSACFWTGEYWNCLCAFTRIFLGEPAHKAFGMDKGGKPNIQGFTRVDDAVFRTEWLIQRGVPSEAALDAGCEAAKIGIARRREVQKHRAKIRGDAPSGLIIIDPFATSDDADDKSGG